jgi:hypothetical protein
MSAAPSAIRNAPRDPAAAAATVRHYSLRRLNPYQGTVQIAEVPGFRAMSVDGITWQVQVLQHHPRISGYGTWRADGSGDLIETDRTRELLRALREHPALPFAAVDRLELWLLDARERLPLALLASALPSPRPPRVYRVQWQAALAGDGSFVAPSLGTASAEAFIPHRDVVDRCVQNAAGAQPVAQWFLRDAGGRGTGLGGYRVDAELDSRVLDAELFPELLVREEWSRGTERDLVREYHDWLAPALLTHRGLHHATRDRLERAACRQAEKLYRLRYLLGDIVNAELIKVAMVEAVLRRSARP